MSENISYNKIHAICVNQPIGYFYITKMTVRQIDAIAYVDRRNDNSGTQRPLDTKKVSDIRKYCQDSDATFPSAIILATDVNGEKDSIELETEENGLYSIKYSESKKFAKIIDGQHRIEGLLAANLDIDLPVVWMFDLTTEEQAYVFSTINSNQKKVDKSIIYDLFEVYTTRSPFKTCHDLARAFNGTKGSPFYGRLKMLGRGTKEQTLSQGTFVTEITRLISSVPTEDARDIRNGIQLYDDGKLPLRKYFIEEEDKVIFKILFNYFKSVSIVFEEEWSKPDKYILSKTTGFGALVKVFHILYRKGVSEKDLSQDFFENNFKKVKVYFDSKNIKIVSNVYGSGEKAQRTLAEDIIEALEA